MAAPPTFVLAGRHSRAVAVRAIEAAPVGSVAVIKPPKRTLDQNDKLHAVCTDIARQVVWNGKKRNVEAWKDILTAALLTAQHELEVVPGINGGFVLLGLHTSSLTKDQCSELIELAHAFGAEHGVTFSEPETLSSAAQGGREPKKLPAEAAA